MISMCCGPWAQSLAFGWRSLSLSFFFFYTVLCAHDVDALEGGVRAGQRERDQMRSDSSPGPPTDHAETSPLRVPLLVLPQEPCQGDTRAQQRP